MNPDPKGTRNKIIISSVAIIAVVLLIIFLMPNKRPAPGLELKNFNRLPGTVDTSRMGISGDNIYVSNGRNLVRFNKQTGSTEAVTNTTEMPVIKRIIVSPSDTFLAFEIGSPVGDIEPFRSVPGVGGSDDSPQWWLLNLQTKNISSVTYDTDSFLWLNDQDYLYTSDKTILKSSVSKKEPTTYFTAESAVTLLGLRSNTVYIKDLSNGVFSVAADGKATQLHDAAVSNAVFSPTSDCLFFQQLDDETDESTNELKNCNGKSKTIEGEIINAKFSNDGKRLYYFVRREAHDLTGKYIDLESMREGDWSVKIGDKPSEDIEIFSVNNEDDAIIRQGNSYYAQNSKAIKSPDTAITLRTGSTAIDYNVADHVFVASKSGQYSDGDKQAVTQAIANEGYSPELFSISFVVLTEENNRFN